MLRKGYFERQIEGLAIALAKVLGLKERGDYSGALTELRAARARLTGLPPETVDALPEGTLLSLLAAGGDFDTGKGIVLGSLLAEEAGLLDHYGREAEGVATRRKALTLLLEALREDEGLRTAERRAKIEEIAGALGAELIPPALLLRLSRLREATGDYAGAEDAHYALRDRNVTGADAEAAAFYRRLQALPDGALEDGGLSREEVDEGLAAVLGGGG